MKFEREKSVTRKEALQGITERWPVAPLFERVSLDKAAGRVLAEDAYARYALPVVRSSRLDGIAVRSADFATKMPDTRTWEPGRNYVQADTGDDFDDAFDAVVAIEDVVYLDGGGLELTVTPDEVKAGSRVSPSGSLVKEGSLLMCAKTLLGPEHAAALAIGGHFTVLVLRRPVVAFIPTGSELVPYGTKPHRGQNIEANSLLVNGMLASWGAEPLIYPIIKDDQDALERALDDALALADIVLINGGSSRGKEDFNSTLIEARASYFRHGVRAVPGRPIGLALVDGTPVLNIPGPVIATFLAMDWLVRGLVSHYFGIAIPGRPVAQARLLENIEGFGEVERLARVALSVDEEGALCCKTLSRSLGVPQTITLSDGILTVPIGCAGYQQGERVNVNLLRPLEEITRIAQNVSERVQEADDCKQTQGVI
jgi:molybdopterin molybdotransferase/putative molybdopterin biosynthesis protein